LKPKPDNAPTVISLFAGCGGSSLGYSMAGFRELLAVEWDDNAVETFKMNFPDIPVFHGDIAKCSIDWILETTGLKIGELDILDGSPPCQGFSTAGKRIMDDDRNQLFREFIRILRGLQPKVFVMENVSGMVKGKMKLIFAEIIQELKSSNYRVAARLMNTMWFNVPQARERIIIIGIRKDYLAGGPIHPIAEEWPITARQALVNIKNETYHRPLATVASNIWNHITPGQNGTYYRKNYYMNTVKVNPDRPCCTIPKVVPGTGGLLHWKEKRTMTIEEIKRFASFPDEYKMTGNFVNKWERIGNSVPPLFMRSIANHIRNNILNVTQ
jgi:DNA (cytosine-5)-methyltransferase 1